MTSETGAKKKRRILLILALLIVCIALGFLIGNYYYGIGFPAEDTRWAEKYPELAAAEQIGLQMPDADWLSRMEYEEVRTSVDGLVLHGYLVTHPDTARYVILAHGYRANAESMAAYAARFYEMGYNVLLPDLRSCGKSDGEVLGMGWTERKDIVVWSNYLVKQQENAQIVLFGLSTGGAAVLLSTQSSDPALPKQVVALIADSSYDELQSLFQYQIKQSLHLPATPLLTFLSNTVSAKAAYSLMTDGSVLSAVKTEVRKENKVSFYLPTLFLGGSEDDTLPPNAVQSLYDEAKGEKELVLIEGAGHNAAALTDPETYWQAVKDFLAAYVES